MAKAREACSQKQDRLFRLVQMPGGVKVLPGRAFILVVEAGGEAIQFQRFEGRLLHPQQAGQAGDPAESRPVAQGAPRPVTRVGEFPRVFCQFLGVAQKKDRRRLPTTADFAQQRQSFITLVALAEAVQFPQQQAPVVGKQLEQAVELAQTPGRIAVVPGERQDGLKHQGMFGRRGLQRFQDSGGFVAAMSIQRKRKKVELSAQLAVREVQGVKKSAPRERRECHAPGTGRALLFQERIRRVFEEMAIIGIAHDESALDLIVTDHGLGVAGGSAERGKLERHAAVQQRFGGRPCHGEFADNPALAFRPVPASVRGRPGVADVLGHFELADGLVPIRAQRGERCRSAGVLVLRHKRHGQLDAAKIPAASRGPLGKLEPRGLANLARCRAGSGGVSGPPGDPGAERKQPLSNRFFQDG